MHLNASPTKVQQIKEETAKDETLHSLRAIITQGWPDKQADCPAHHMPTGTIETNLLFLMDLS